ncbi:MAG TPA: YkvA family protein, partial [Marinagarivorans sp.]|nr:YkvA family protein [Marinagarivorans sp.]
EQYSQQYSDEGFWQKVKTTARSAGVAVLENGLKMYYAARDDKTPAWAKATLYSALGYFICPIDAIPDMLPVVGFSDDLGVLIAAAATTAAYITDEHGAKAKELVKRWLPGEKSSQTDIKSAD